MLRAYVSPYGNDDEDRALDEVGPLAVLGAMVAQRRRATVPPVTSSVATPAKVDESGAHPRQRMQSSIDPIEGLDVFQKIR